MRKQKWFPVLLAALSLCIALTACGSGSSSDGGGSGGGNSTAGEGPFDPLGKYDETVHITQTRILTSWMGFDDGENEDNNWWTRTYKDRLNIELTNLFTAPNWGPDFDQKINMAMATDDLPDVMPLYTTLAVRAIQGNKVMDIKEAFDKYASQQVKDIFNLEPKSLKAWEFDGKLFGLSPPPNPELWSYFWIPKSMLDELNGGAVPATFAEVEALAFKIKEKTGAYAIGMNNSVDKLKDISFMFHGTDVWYDQGGELVYGKLMPETKAAWAKAAEWYDNGILAKDFASKADEDVEADFLNGKFGIFIDGTNFPNGPVGRNWILINPDDDMVAVPIMAVDDKPLSIMRSSDYGGCLMISYKCKNPDAVFRLYNLGTAISNDFGRPDFISDTEYNTTAGGNMGFWNRLCTGSGYAEDSIPTHQPGYLAMEAFNKGSKDELVAMRAFGAIESYDRIYNWVNEGTSAPEWEINWSVWSMWVGAKSQPYGRQMFADGRITKTDKLGQETNAEAENNQNLYAKYIEYATMGIMGGAGNVESQFDDWVNYFYANGGTAIYDEVNTFYKENK